MNRVNNFVVGDEVCKNRGYLWPGVVVAVFTTLNNECRIVVECTAEAVKGALHIFNPDQLEYVVPPMPLEPPPGWQGGSMPPTGSAHTISPPVAATPARSLRTLTAFVSAGKHYLTMNEAAAMFNFEAGNKWYPVFNTPQGIWEPHFDTEYHNCIGYKFKRR